MGVVWSSLIAVGAGGLLGQAPGKQSSQPQKTRTTVAVPASGLLSKSREYLQGVADPFWQNTCS